MSEKKKTVSELQAAVREHGSQRAAARALGMRESTFRLRLHAGAAAPRVAPSGTRVGRALSEFRAVYDKAYIVPRKIKAALGKIGASGWLYEVEFAKLAGVSLADLGNFRDQFSEYVVATREKRAWAGSRKTADEMRTML